MARLIWAVLCERASIDRETNTVSLFGVIEQVQIEGEGQVDDPNAVILAPMRCQLVSFWIRSEPAAPERFFQRVMLLHPDAARFETGTTEVDLGSNPRSRVLAEIQGIPLKATSGLYHFTVECRADEASPWIEVARLPFDVSVQVVSTTSGSRPAST